MTNEQFEHMTENTWSFQKEYQKKYTAGQKEHGGNMWDMGAYQALENMEDEVLDMWSYCRQVRQCLDEINRIAQIGTSHTFMGDQEKLLLDIHKILNRVKGD